MSLLDLRKFFDLPEKGLIDPSKVIVVRGGCLEVGILADAIVGVRSVGAARAATLVPTPTGIRAECLNQEISPTMH